VIRVHDAAGNVIEIHEHVGEFKEWWSYETVGIPNISGAFLQFFWFLHCSRFFVRLTGRRTCSMLPDSGMFDAA